MPFAGSGTKSAVRLPAEYVTVWNVPLENVTLSPAVITSFDGMNWLMLPKSLSFRIAAGGGPCSPRNTVYVVASAAERAGIAAPGTASAATATHAISRCFIVLSPLSRTIRLCALARCQRAGRRSLCLAADGGAYNRHSS